ncbi:hypothetical protein RUM44_013449 [Polyplax serrata]|uniref:Uncharacterized protein n=1 Tax=Polyplax serrata TaxID=468196 RepID=A0ABR1BG49_POLSC
MATDDQEKTGDLLSFNMSAVNNTAILHSHQTTLVLQKIEKVFFSSPNVPVEVELQEREVKVKMNIPRTSNVVEHVVIGTGGQRPRYQERQRSQSSSSSSSSQGQNGSPALASTAPKESPPDAVEDIQQRLKQGWTVHVTHDNRLFYCK